MNRLMSELHENQGKSHLYAMRTVLVGVFEMKIILIHYWSVVLDLSDTHLSRQIVRMYAYRPPAANFMALVTFISMR